MKKDEIGTLFGQRLQQARAMAGYSLRGLSDAMGGAVSYNALNKYEKGEMLPSSDVLVILAGTLGRNTDFFFTPFNVHLEKVAFRKRITKLSKTQETKIGEISRDYFERYLSIERILEVGQSFKNPLGDEYIVDTPEKAEEAAALLREKWKLGTAPLPNVSELLEEAGIKIFEVPNEDDGFDGFSARSGDIRVIVISKHLNDNLTRKRMTLVHELGHLLFQIPETLSRKEEENLMDRFGGAFLIPKEVMFERIGTKRKKVSVQEYIDLKMLYGISISALVVRADQLGIVPHSYTQSFWVFRRKWGWDKTGEPMLAEYNDKGDETSRRFTGLVYRGLAEGVISISKASALLDRPIHELRGSLEI